MKPRALFFILLVLIVVLLIIWSRRRHSPSADQDNKLSAETASSSNESAHPFPQSSSKARKQNQGPPQSALVTTPFLNIPEDLHVLREFEKTPANLSLQERLDDLVRRGFSLTVLTQQMLTQLSNMTHEASQQINQKIDFYGKVVDESEAPLPGSTVEFHGIAFPEAEFRTNVVSGADGKFFVGGITGVTVFVRVNREGYEEIRGTNKNKFVFQSPMPPDGFQSDPDNPIVFRLRKKTLER